MRAGALACLVLVAAVSGAVAAGTTAVSVEPGQTTADVGETAMVDVVVESADGGVGAWESTVNLTDSEVAAIVDVRLHGDPGLQTVEIAADNNSVYFDGALANTNDTGAVTIATLEIEVTGTGETGLALAVDALGDESGNSYTVSETYDGILRTDGTTAGGGDTDRNADNTEGSTEDQSTSTAPAEDTATDSSNSAAGSTSRDRPTTNTESETTATNGTETTTVAESSTTATVSGDGVNSATESSPSSDAFAPGFSLVTALLAIGLAAFALRRR